MGKQIFIFVFTKIASTQTFVALMGLTILGFVYLNQIHRAVVVALAFVSFIAVIQILKVTFKTIRPPHPIVTPEGYSFPSGHAAATMFLGILGAWLVSIYLPAWLIPAIFAFGAVIIIVGVSRVVLRLHTLFEVIAGYILGLIWGLGTLYLLVHA